MKLNNAKLWEMSLCFNTFRLFGPNESLMKTEKK